MQFRFVGLSAESDKVMSSDEEEAALNPEPGCFSLTPMPESVNVTRRDKSQIMPP